MNAASTQSMLDIDPSGKNLHDSNEFLADRSHEVAPAANLHSPIVERSIIPSGASRGLQRSNLSSSITPACPRPINDPSETTSLASLRRVRDAVFHARDVDANNAWIFSPCVDLAKELWIEMTKKIDSGTLGTISEMRSMFSEFIEKLHRSEVEINFSLLERLVTDHANNNDPNRKDASSIAAVNDTQAVDGPYGGKASSAIAAASSSQQRQYDAGGDSDDGNHDSCYDDICPLESVHIRRLKERLLDREVDEDKYPVLFRAVLDAGVAAAVQYAADHGITIKSPPPPPIVVINPPQAVVEAMPVSSPVSVSTPTSRTSLSPSSKPSGLIINLSSIQSRGRPSAAASPPMTHTPSLASTPATARGEITPSHLVIAGIHGEEVNEFVNRAMRARGADLSMWLPHATTETKPPNGQLKGVAAIVAGGPYAAMLRHIHRNLILGVYSTETEAARAYDIAVIRCCGASKVNPECINFPLSEYMHYPENKFNEHDEIYMNRLRGVLWARQEPCSLEYFLQNPALQDPARARRDPGAESLSTPPARDDRSIGIDCLSYDASSTTLVSGRNVDARRWQVCSSDDTRGAELVRGSSGEESPSVPRPSSPPPPLPRPSASPFASSSSPSSSLRLPRDMPSPGYDPSAGMQTGKEEASTPLKRAPRKQASAVVRSSSVQPPMRASSHPDSNRTADGSSSSVSPVSHKDSSSAWNRSSDSQASVSASAVLPAVTSRDSKYAGMPVASNTGTSAGDVPVVASTVTPTDSTWRRPYSSAAAAAFTESNDASPSQGSKDRRRSEASANNDATSTSNTASSSNSTSSSSRSQSNESSAGELLQRRIMRELRLLAEVNSPEAVLLQPFDFGGASSLAYTRRQSAIVASARLSQPQTSSRGRGRHSNRRGGGSGSRGGGRGGRGKRDVSDDSYSGGSSTSNAPPGRNSSSNDSSDSNHSINRGGPAGSGNSSSNSESNCNAASAQAPSGAAAARPSPSAASSTPPSQPAPLSPMAAASASSGAALGSTPSPPLPPASAVPDKKDTPQSSTPKGQEGRIRSISARELSSLAFDQELAPRNARRVSIPVARLAPAIGAEQVYQAVSSSNSSSSTTGAASGPPPSLQAYSSSNASWASESSRALSPQQAGQSSPPPSSSLSPSTASHDDASTSQPQQRLQQQQRVSRVSESSPSSQASASTTNTDKSTGGSAMKKRKFSD